MNRIASLLFSVVGALNIGLIFTSESACAATHYFAVTRGGTISLSDIYSYNTTTNSVAQITTVNWDITASGHGHTHASAGKDGSFWIGASNSSTGAGTTDGVMRYVPNSLTSPTSWNLDFAVSMQGQGPFIGQTVNPAAAELASGAFILADTRDNKFATGTLNPSWSGGGTITATTAVGLSGSTLNSAVGLGSGGNGLDIASTFAGSSNRFIVSAYNEDSAVMVYNADGTHAGNLTNLAGSPANGVGTMRSSGQGDIALQLASNVTDSGQLFRVSGRSVADGTFDQLAFSFNVSGATNSWIAATDVDGTDDGLIMVTGLIRTGTDKLAVQFFDTSGLAVSPVFALQDFGGASSGSRPSGVVLNFPTAAPTPEPSTYALLALGGVALVWRVRRKKAVRG